MSIDSCGPQEKVSIIPAKQQVDPPGECKCMTSLKLTTELCKSKARARWLIEKLVFSFECSGYYEDEEERDPAYWLKQAQEATE